MSPYLVALIGLIVILAVGFLCYGVIFKETVSGNSVPKGSGRMIGSAVGMYLIALMFTVLYNDITFANGATGIMRGIYLGLIVGLSGFVIPIMIDNGYLSGQPQRLTALWVNWLAAFLVLGIVVGILIP